MTGVITSLPPLIEQPPGNNSSNPAGLPGVVYQAAVPTQPQTWSGLQTFLFGSVQFAGSTSGNTFLNASAIASGTVALPAITGTDTLLANNNIAIVTNKSIDGLTNTLTNIPTGSLDPDLQALAALTGTGFSARTAADTWALRTVTGTAAEITVTNGDGVAGAPTLSLPTALTFTGKTIAGGTFNSPALVTPALGTPASGVATNLTGTAAGLTAGNATLAANVTTNANMTGDVTSVGNATTIGANKVTRAMQAQGVARSVIGVTGNATANVADIQGTASQFLGVNSAGTALAFGTMSGDATLSGPAITIATNAVTNAKMAQGAAATLKGNVTNALANVADFTIQGLTNLAAPSATLDFIPIYDHVAGTIKSVTPGAIAASSVAGVSSLNSATGALNFSVVHQKFSASGTYTPTTGMAYCVIECVGGGGAGGGTAGGSTIMDAGGGGGAGGYSRLVASSATIGASQTVTIGAGGTAGTAGNNPGNAGGDTSVGVLCIGKGGSGGLGQTGGRAGQGGAGGVAGTGDDTFIGNPGLMAIGGASTIFTTYGGAGACSYFGAGGRSQVQATNGSSNGNAGATGGGGSGGCSLNSATNSAGGAGGNGYVIITEFIIH